jgi:glycosyltransferase involved in cell wall biosynthesis
MPQPDEAGDRPRVALILHKFSRGGSDRVAAYLAKGIRDAGMRVELVVLCRGGEVENHLVNLVDDIPIRYFDVASRSRGWDLVRTFPKLVRYLRAARLQAVISTANNTALATAFAVKAAGVANRTRLLLKTTNPIATSRHRRITKWLRRASYALIFRWTDGAWTLSADESDEMRKAFPRFGSIFREVLNPYVTPAMLAVRQSAPRRAKTVITIARLTEQKRLDRLIAAFAEVTDPNLRLLVLGEGEKRNALEQQVAQLGLEKRILMPGYVPEVAQALHDADLFVLTSDYEGLPAAILEAMAANCPVLCTDCFPAARTLLGTAEGCSIIEDTAPKSLAAQIETALARPRPASLRALAERYSIENGVRDHIDALRSVLPNGPGRVSV